MSAGVPVMIHLPAEVFRTLEVVAERRGTTMRRLIESHVERGVLHATHSASIERRLARLQPHQRAKSPAPAEGKRGHVRLTTEQQAELVELTRLGWSANEIAKRYGCSHGTIVNWRRRLDAHPRQR